MKRLLLAASLLAASSLHAQQLQSFDIKADDWAEGEPPKDVFVVDGTIKIAARDGNKAIVVDPNPVTDASAQLAISASGNASIEARVLAIKRGRSTPRFGVSVHGMSGHRLMVNPAKKSLDLVKGTETLASVPFAWTSEAWVRIKLEAKKAEGDAWTITGKAWPADAAEPAEPLIKHPEKNLKGQGKCAIWATPFSGEPVFFDDIKISVEAATAAP
ncbi:hypothetical protein [Prosthecobacter fluviatilis]|uniref:Uncharacterized protein n=1 Tax=Prosthecobacter fluviatilis TaxID=445931 RepID=A0ABW0KY18_9BACT